MPKAKDQVLLVPGLYNSGPGHWQTLWENEYGFARVEQRDWETPRCADWVRTLDEVIRAQDVPVVLVAHSLGCITVAHWATAAETAVVKKVRGALLVAPSDVERQDFPPGTVGFAPMPLDVLPFSSVLVASTNDAYTSFAKSEELARRWSSRLENVGPRGHITSVDGFGPWPEGLALLNQLRASYPNDL